MLAAEGERFFVSEAVRCPTDPPEYLARPAIARRGARELQDLIVVPKAKQVVAFVILVGRVQMGKVPWAQPSTIPCDITVSGLWLQNSRRLDAGYIADAATSWRDRPLN